MTGFFRTLWQLVAPYWRSGERWVARLLLAVIVALNLGEVYINVLLNQWNNDFYNSLQAVDKAAFMQAIIRFSYLAASIIAIAVYKIYLRQMLQIKWRRWLTAKYLTDWLGMQNYYRMQLFGSSTDNPDQRISEDIEQFLRLTLVLSLELLNAVVTLFSFLLILWRLCGSFDFTIHGKLFSVPGYMVWVALVYALIGTWITLKIGRPLIRLNFDQQQFEANFRFSMVRLRENSESIAFYKGETQERANFMGRFAAVMDNFRQIIKRQKLLTWFTSGYSQIAIIFPYVVAAPRFFAHQIQLGGLMQIASAFERVQQSLSYIINAYSNTIPEPNIATWKAVTDRLKGFNTSIKQAEDSHIQSDKFQRHLTEERLIKADDIAIKLPDGRILLEHINLHIKPGDSLLVTGPSGAGKSTLLRALAGLWPFVEGQITLPASASMLFLPQKPYIPLGNLRQALCYPYAPDAEDARLKEALSLCGLAQLADSLDTPATQWPHVLSVGEQQRVAFARAFLARPDFIFLDEATSALDEASEARLYETLQSRLPHTAIVSVGHRSTLRAWHKTEKAL
jgi:putative ATP-binding cassette transporter